MGPNLVVNHSHDSFLSVFAGEADVDFWLGGLGVMGHWGRCNLANHKINAQALLKFKFVDVLLKDSLGFLLTDEGALWIQVVCFRAELSDEWV